MQSIGTWIVRLVKVYGLAHGIRCLKVFPWNIFGGENGGKVQMDYCAAPKNPLISFYFRIYRNYL